MATINSSEIYTEADRSAAIENAKDRLREPIGFTMMSAAVSGQEMAQVLRSLADEVEEKIVKLSVKEK